MPQTSKSAPARRRAPARDHREDIFAACAHHTAALRAALDGERDPGEPDGEPRDVATYMNEDLLEIDAMRDPNDAERYRIRFVLTLGGPTVEVCVDSRDGVTYSHSWGKASARATARDLREITLGGAQREAWELLAESYRECR